MRKKTTIKDRFQFDLGILFQPTRVINDDIYCFEFDESCHYNSEYFFIKVFKKLGYRTEYDIEKYRYNLRRNFEGISINQNTKEFWFYAYGSSCRKIVTNSTNFNMYELSYECSKIYNSNPGLLVKSNSIPYNVYVLNERNVKTYKLPDYIVNYKLPLHQKLKEWWMYF